MTFPHHSVIQGSGGGGAWDPSSLGSSLILFDMSDLTKMWTDTGGTTPISSDGQTCGKIADKYGLGYSCSQSTSTKRPVWNTDGALSWLNGSSTNAVVLTNSGNSFASTSDYAMAVAFKCIDNGYGGGYMAMHGGYPNIYASSGLPHCVVMNTAATSGGYYAHDALDINSNYVAVARKSGATFDVTINNVSVYSSTIVGASAIAGESLLFGIPDTAYTNDHLYAEAFFSGALSNSDLAKLSTWLGAKAGLTI